jgi:hypothetical protein
MDGCNVLVIMSTDDGPRTLALCVADNVFSAGHHILALGNAHDESEALYDDPWPKYSGYPRTMQRTDGRLYNLNNNDTISPVGAPHLVLGLRNALPEATATGGRRSSSRRKSSVSSMGSLPVLERFQLRAAVGETGS